MIQNDFYINKSNIHTTEWRACRQQSQPLQDKEIRIALQSFSFSANNITYALLGKRLAYWQFFPTDDLAWGRIPVWGFAEVIESNNSDVIAGERLYGYFPLASHWILKPNDIKHKQFFDGSSHRTQLPAIYNQYSRISNDPLHSVAQESLQALLKPLFTTSYTLDDYLLDNQFFDCNNLLLSCASSKTAIATAYLLSKHREKRKKYTIIGLTSPNRKGYVKSLGCYDQVFSYEELPSLAPNDQTAYLDFSGSMELRNTIHHIFGEKLNLSCQIGAADWTHVGPSTDLPSVEPNVFFAPAQLSKRIDERGAVSVFQDLGTAWIDYIKFADQSIELVDIIGPKNIEGLYQNMLKGNIDARHGYIINF